MRWLLLKDLQILKRSPLLVGVLIAYSVVVSLVAGLALSSGPGKPRVAFANLVPEDKSEVALGGRKVDATQYADKLFAKVEPIRVKTREQAIAKVKSGEALGALVVPADVTERLQGTLGLGGGERPTVEVYYSAENPLKTQFVKDTIDATLAEANAAISAEVLRESAKYLNVIVAGGKVALPLVGSVDILGLRNARKIIDAALAELPEDAPERVALEQVSRFAGLAADNLDLSKPILSSISKPVQVKRIVVAGSDSSLSAFAAEVAVIASMMFVALLIAAGMLALEREENAFGRLVRGLISRTALVTEKVALAALVAFVITTVMLGILAALIGFDFTRGPLWLVALALGAAAFGAMGVAIGGVTREVRSASLAAFVVSLPVAALALIPAGAVNETLYDVIRVVSGAFPFRPALQALDAAISGGTLLTPLLHLAALTLAFGVIARVSLRRWASRRLTRGARDHRQVRPRPSNQGPVASLPGGAGARSLGRPVRKPTAPTTIGAWPSPPPACAASVPPPASATSCARRSWPRGTSSTRCSSSTAPTAGRRSRRCRGSTTSRSATRCRRPARPPRSGSRPCCCSGCPATKDEEGSGAWDDEGVIQLAIARDQGRAPRPAGDHRPLPVRVHEPRPLRRAARRRRRRQRRDARAARPHRRLPGRARAPTSSRRAT